VTGSPWFPDGQPEPLVLASASPRRCDLLRQIGLRFTQVVADIDESWPDGMPLDEAATEIARRKAGTVASMRSDGVILAADTAVVLDGCPLGKPRSADDAARMLWALGGVGHTVMTGVAIVDVVTGRSMSGASRTDVWMRRPTEREVEQYVLSGEPLDKAGAYGIQGLGGAMVTRIDGCYFNVVGLPLELVVRYLQELERDRRSAE